MKWAPVVIKFGQYAHSIVHWIPSRCVGGEGEGEAEGGVMQYLCMGMSWCVDVVRVMCCASISSKGSLLFVLGS